MTITADSVKNYIAKLTREALDSYNIPLGIGGSDYLYICNATDFLELETKEFKKLFDSHKEDFESLGCKLMSTKELAAATDATIDSSLYKGKTLLTFPDGGNFLMPNRGIRLMTRKGLILALYFMGKLEVESTDNTDTVFENVTDNSEIVEENIGENEPINNNEIYNTTEFEHNILGKFRAVIINDEPWFVGRDICAIFDDKNHIRSLGGVEEEDKICITIYDRFNRKQKATCINESGLYSLLFLMQP